MQKNKFNVSEWLDKKPNNNEVPVINHIIPTSSNNSNFSDIQQEIELVTKMVEEKAIDIAPDYQTWRDMGFALADALNECGRAYYHRLSCFYPEYSHEETDKQYTRCLNAKGQGITYKTLFHIAKQAGITIAPIASITHTNPFRKNSKTSSEVFEVIKRNEPADKVKMPTFYGKIKDRLPDFLKKIVDNSTSEEDADMLILGSIVSISACLPNIFGIYDRREVYPNLFLFVTAQASSGKGRLTLCRKLLEPIHNQLRAEYEVEMEIYQQKLTEFAVSKKQPGAKPPVEPVRKMLFISADNSSTSVYQLLSINNGVGLIFETEGDTLTNTFKSDYGNFSSGFRKAFHHEPISYSRRKDNESVEMDKPRMSAVLSGTPQQVLSLIPCSENGLFSRFIFYYLETEPKWKNVFESNDIPLDTVFENYSQEFFGFYQLLKTSSPIRFSLTASQEKQFNSLFNYIHDECYSIFGSDILPSVRRLGLITYRFAMILSALRLLEDGELPNVLVCNDDDFYTAKTMIETLLKHTVKVFDMLPEKNIAFSQGHQHQLKQQYFDALPHEFDTQTAINIAQSVNIPQKTAERHLKKWCFCGQLNRVRHGWYSKAS